MGSNYSKITGPALSDSLTYRLKTRHSQPVRRLNESGSHRALPDTYGGYRPQRLARSDPDPGYHPDMPLRDAYADRTIYFTSVPQTRKDKSIIKMRLRRAG